MSIFRSLKTLLIGPRLSNDQIEHEKLNVPLGLAVFSSDALSSTAYATDEILIALSGTVLAAQAGSISVPVALFILALIALVILSYRQVIQAYPGGGGSYIVARRNLGILPSHVAAAALLIDYVLTVAVSVSAGIAAMISTGCLAPMHATACCIVCTVGIMTVNLRGVRQSSLAFAIPAYLFVASMGILILAGLCNVHFGLRPTAITMSYVHNAAQVGSLTYTLVFLKAFSHGCAGLTGIEAVSNGVRAFKAPSSKHANQTMALMGCLLSAIFLGVTYLAFAYEIRPIQNESIISQIASATFGKGTILYWLVQLSTLTILILAANTAFADFPRVAKLLADDGYLPRQLKNIGDRLVFNNGILILGLLSAVLLYVYHGDTHRLIPMYAVGVFVSFTLSQSGMVRHHLRERDPGWKSGVLVNVMGAVTMAVVTVILAIEKFAEGAWIIMLAIPLLISLFGLVKAHYDSVGKQLALDDNYPFPVPRKHKVPVLVSSLGRGTVPALAYARALSDDAQAVHIELDAEASQVLRAKWERCGAGVPLVILPSPYRSISEPLVEYLDSIDRTCGSNTFVTIVIPEFVTKELWHIVLHNQTAFMLRTLLRFRKGTIVTSVRFYLDE